MLDRIRTDVAVIGAGCAGLRAALAAAAANCSVTVLSKGPLNRSGITAMSSEGFQAPFAAGDSPEVHFKDTLEAGAGLCEAPLAWLMAQGAADEVRRLEAWGARFRKEADGRFTQTIRPGVTVARNCFIVEGGHGMLRAYGRAAARTPHIALLEDRQVVRLVMGEGRAAGLIALDLRAGGLTVIEAGAVVAAAGGNQALWPHTSTPADATGELLALAHRAGADLVDMEFMLFIPAVVVHPERARGILLVYEHVLNPDMLGGRFVNGRDEPFVEGYPRRDAMMQAIIGEVLAGRAAPHGGVFLDLTRTTLTQAALTERLRYCMPKPFGRLLKLGVDLRTQRVEVAPGAHYNLGGIRMDSWGRTAVPGLLACGEAGGNVHGANRLSGNAFPECLVFAARAGAEAARAAREGRTPDADWRGAVKEVLGQQAAWCDLGGGNGYGNGNGKGVRPIHLKAGLQEIMGRFAGVVRDEGGLRHALARIGELRAEALPALRADAASRFCRELGEAHEVTAMLDLAELVVRSALFRTESRGHHLRTDHPARDDAAWRVRTLVCPRATGPELATVPVTDDREAA
jgi:succinate dehydrogenase/fumarate reductase flavoprotein subunit